MSLSDDPECPTSPFNSSDIVRETAITLAPNVLRRILVIDRPRPFEAPVWRWRVEVSRSGGLKRTRGILAGDDDHGG